MIPESDIVKGLKKLTERGIKLREIEVAIGMPLNSLSRNLKSEKIPAKYKEPLFEFLKEKEIDIILGRKPMPETFKKSLAALDDFIANVSKEDKDRILKEVKEMKIGGPSMKEFFGDLFDFGVAITHTDAVTKKQRTVPILSNEGASVINYADIQAKIDKIREELKHPPSNPLIGLRKWIAVRELQITELEKQKPSI